VPILRALILVTLLLAAPASAAAADAVRVGEVERVQVRGADGAWRTVLARMDTGAERSSIDRALAERLGLEAAPCRVSARSASGRVTRSLVRAELAVGDVRRRTELSVADRSALSAPLLVGRRDMGGFTVAVGERHLLAESGPFEPPAPGELPSTRALLSGFALAAALVVLLRMIVGLETFGVFAPVLLAFSFVLGGMGPGLLLLGITLVLALLLPRVLHALRLPRVARLAVLVAVVAGVVLGLEVVLAAPSAAAGGLVFPIVVTAAIMERFWDLWEDDDVGEALRRMAATVGFAVCVAALLGAPDVAAEADRLALPLIVVAGLLSVGVGLYRGLRLTELRRFRPVARQSL